MLPQIVVSAQRQPISTPFLQRQPCQSFSGFFAANNAALGLPTSFAGISQGLLGAATTVYGAATTIGSLPAGALVTTAPTAVSATTGGLTLAGIVAGAAYLGSQIGSAIVAAANSATCY